MKNAELQNVINLSEEFFIYSQSYGILFRGIIHIFINILN